MVIVLLALALAMMAGGFFSAFSGWDIVVSERGWTMVLAGSVMAAGGALLLGIAVAVSRLSAIRAERVRLNARASPEVPSAAIASRRLADDPAALAGAGLVPDRLPADGPP